MFQIIVHKALAKQWGRRGKQTTKFGGIYSTKKQDKPYKTRKMPLGQFLQNCTQRKWQQKQTNTQCFEVKTTNSEEEVESTNYTAHKKNNGTKIRRMNSSRRPVSRLPNDLATVSSFFSDQTHSSTHWTKIHKKSKCVVCDNIKMFTNKTDHLVK